MACIIQQNRPAVEVQENVALVCIYYVYYCIMYINIFAYSASWYLSLYHSIPIHFVICPLS